MYDIFISFKSMGEDGMPTRDSVLAREIYDRLSGRGFNVFFSLVTLEKLGISAYKYAIDKALDSARILVAVGTSTENLDSQWVRYEWDSFFNDIISGIKPEGRLFTCIEGCDNKSLPRVLRQSQVFNRNDGGIDKLINFISNSISNERKKGASAAKAKTEGNTEPLIGSQEKAKSSKFTFQKEVEEQYGREATQPVETYPFFKTASSMSNQEMFGCIKDPAARKDIYISYRRDGGIDFTRILVERLEKANYNVFFDVDDLRTGIFNEKHKFFIESCIDFILVLPRGALTRCKNPDDWLRIEIEWAIENKKNIIPIMLNGFEWLKPEDLPESLRNLQHYNALESSHKYFDASMAMLTQMLLSKPFSRNIHT